MSTCTLIDPDWNQCCCNCAHHRPVHHHPATSGQSIRVRKGWSCANPELWPMVFDDWPAHSIGCEGYQAMTEDDKRRTAE